MLGNEYNLSDSKMYTILRKYNNVAELDYSVSIAGGLIVYK